MNRTSNEATVEATAGKAPEDKAPARKKPVWREYTEALLVAGILVPIASPLCIVPSPGKGFLGLPPDTGVEKDFHESVWRSNGSMRSWPTTRFAYTRQAWTSSGSSQG